MNNFNAELSHRLVKHKVNIYCNSHFSTIDYHEDSRANISRRFSEKLGNVCTITQCRRKREHNIDSFQNPVSFQENGVNEENKISPPASNVSSDSGTVRLDVYHRI